MDLGINGRHAIVCASSRGLGKACEAPDILVTNNAGPPPGAFADWGPDEWQAALEANLLAPTFMIQGVIEGMKERRFGRIVNITSAMVKSPHAAMGLSTAARSGPTFEDARQAIANTINAKRFGQPEELGDACAYLCSAQAGFICGQNLQLDGGSYAGLI